jgi:hypothetical protein
LLTATFAAMLFTAKLFSKSEAKQERKPTTESIPEGSTKIAQTTVLLLDKKSKEAEQPR